MPLQRCQKDGVKGWQWGSEGKCYPYGSGSDLTENEAKSKAYEQALAIGEEIEASYVAKSREEMHNFTLGIVYMPDEVDLQGHFAEEDVIQKAAWGYVKKLQGYPEEHNIAMSLYDSFIKLALGEVEEVKIDITKMDNSLAKSLNDMHSDRKEVGTVVESYIAPTDFKLNDEEIKKGTWLLGVQWSDEYFDKILTGERQGLSLEGKGLLRSVGGD